MRYKVGAEQMGRIRPLAHRPDGIFTAARTAPIGPTHAVDATSGAVACGVHADGLKVLDEDWEEGCFVEKCLDCLVAVLAHGSLNP